MPHSDWHTKSECVLYAIQIVFCMPVRLCFVCQSESVLTYKVTVCFVSQSDCVLYVSQIVFCISVRLCFVCQSDCVLYASQMCVLYASQMCALYASQIVFCMQNSQTDCFAYKSDCVLYASQIVFCMPVRLCFMSVRLCFRYKTQSDWHTKHNLTGIQNTI